MITDKEKVPCHAEDRAEPGGIRGGYSYLDIEDDTFVSVDVMYGTLEEVVSPTNLNRAYKRVRLNKGASGVDAMSVEGWFRRRIRMCIWKLWKNAKTRVRNLLRCGLSLDKAKIHSYCSVGY